VRSILDDGVPNTREFLDVALELENFAQHELKDLLNVYRVGGGAENERGLHGLGKLARLLGDFRLLVDGERGKEVVLGADEEGGGGLVKETALLVPVFDTRQRRLSRKIEHEQQGDGVIANKRKHVEILLLASKIPDTKCDIGLAQRDRLLHEVDTESLDVVFVEVALDVLNHQTRLADLTVANHADLDNDFFLFLPQSRRFGLSSLCSCSLLWILHLTGVVS